MGRKQNSTTLDVGLTDEQVQEIRQEAIDWADEQVQLGTYSGLTPEMLRAIYVMVHPLTGNSIVKWADIAGVERKIWPRHRNRDEWKRAVEELRADRRGKQLALADRVIEELTAPGVDAKVRLAAARTIYEREGQFIRRIEHTGETLTPAEREARRRMRERLGNKQEETGESTDGRVLQ